ncbi:SDR family oxidoreductase [Salinisphaera sp.]|uniref:SDR family oxidoreductase n=1 Tax=Salinisphaera sp. TaxID=1914330 RepID=UPI002D773D8E|nr:SDR family oxidoreductase [Salinisphaera sp.]HET7313851.1 SDR family oxidoreductase [Salinisphaera sp.]
MNHEHTRAVVTGGAQGVGFAIAEQLIDEGCRHIVLAGRDIAKGARAVEKLSRDDRVVHFEPIDLRNVDACTRLIETAIEKLGYLNGLVNAAALGARGTLLDTSVELWDAMFETNARAPFFLMQRFVQHRKDSGGGGSIVNILSQNVHCGQSYLTSYSASKGALATLTKNVANAHRFDRIRCNAILPGWMDTPGEDATQRMYHGATDGWLERAEQKQPMGQLAKPAQLAGLASYMLNEQSGVMTGAIVDYDQNVPGSYPE